MKINSNSCLPCHTFAVQSRRHISWQPRRPPAIIRISWANARGHKRTGSGLALHKRWPAKRRPALWARYYYVCVALQDLTQYCLTQYCLYCLQTKHPPEGWKTPRIVADSGLFTVHAATRRTEVSQAARQSRIRASPVQVRLGIGVGPSIALRPLSPSAPPLIMHHRTQAFMLRDAAES